jgi:D-3-phosphoglycerate dehydrogenase
LRILHLEYDQYPPEAIEKLSAIGEVLAYNCQSQEVFFSFLEKEKFDVIFTRLGLMIDREIMKCQPQLKYIVTPTTGLNHIDLAAAKDHNIVLISLKGESEFLSTIKSTAEHTWTLLMALTRNLVAAHSAVVSKKKWERKPFQAGELNGKTIGIIGYGRLGRIVASYAITFGMEVLIFDNDEKQYSSPVDTATAVSLEELLVRSDYVVLMISWSEANNNFFDEKKFSRMKKGAYFINTSRGEMVNENALLQVLNSGYLAGAALDVLDGDSAWETAVPENSELIQYAETHRNLLITPHMGGYGTESIKRTRMFVTDKFLYLLKTEK